MWLLSLVARIELGQGFWEWDARFGGGERSWVGDKMGLVELVVVLIGAAVGVSVSVLTEPIISGRYDISQLRFLPSVGHLIDSLIMESRLFLKSEIFMRESKTSQDFALCPVS